MGSLGELTALRADAQEFPIEATISKVEVNGARTYSVIIRDITERKRLEAELRRRAEELTEADRRKDEFLAMLAHELRNPLAPILNAVTIQRARPDRKRGERAREIIDR